MKKKKKKIDERNGLCEYNDGILSQSAVSFTSKHFFKALTQYIPSLLPAARKFFRERRKHHLFPQFYFATKT